jgi:hypothetical protein
VAAVRGVSFFVYVRPQAAYRIETIGALSTSGRLESRRFFLRLRELILAYLDVSPGTCVFGGEHRCTLAGC